jgi:hypothetical protein
MKQTLFLLSFLTLSLFSKSQSFVELQMGGANYIGASINTGFHIRLSKDSTHLLRPSIGYGSILWNDFAENTSMVNIGMNYQYKNWGGGIEFAGFTPNPFKTIKPTHQLYYGNDMVDIIIYPNAHYTYTTKWDLYFKFSLGAYFAFEKYLEIEDYNYPLNPQYTYSEVMEFAGDVIPGAGVSIGYKFH